MKKTNFDRYLKQQMKDPAFANRFEQAGEAWDVALPLAARTSVEARLEVMKEATDDEMFMADLKATMEDFREADKLEHLKKVGRRASPRSGRMTVAPAVYCWPQFVNDIKSVKRTDDAL